VERAVILSESDLLGPADFPLSDRQGSDSRGSDPQTPQETPAEISRLDAVEKAAIVRALEKHNNNVSRAADALGLTRTSLYRRMEKYGL
jgi:DNA-binding NtrC family response regulator